VWVIEENPVLQMTPVERVALQLLADGRAPIEIANRLRVRECDVEARLRALFARLGVSNGTDAIAAAHKRGLVAIDVSERVEASDAA
jgi:DNA-binding NarL/FixJ family response regulator